MIIICILKIIYIIIVSPSFIEIRTQTSYKCYTNVRVCCFVFAVSYGAPKGTHVEEKIKLYRAHDLLPVPTIYNP